MFAKFNPDVQGSEGESSNFASHIGTWIEILFEWQKGTIGEKHNLGSKPQNMIFASVTGNWVSVICLFTTDLV